MSVAAWKESYKNLEKLSPGIIEYVEKINFNSDRNDSDLLMIDFVVTRAQRLGLMSEGMSAKNYSGRERFIDLLDELEMNASIRIANAETFLNYNPEDHFDNLADINESTPDDLQVLVSEIEQLDECEYEAMGQLQNAAEKMGYLFDIDLQGYPGIIRPLHITQEKAQDALVSYAKDIQWMVELIMEDEKVKAGMSDIRDLIDNSAGKVSTIDFDRRMKGLSDSILNVALRYELVVTSHVGSDRSASIICLEWRPCSDEEVESRSNREGEPLAANTDNGYTPTPFS